jgi:hypothetical protein
MLRCILVSLGPIGGAETCFAVAFLAIKETEVPLSTARLDVAQAPLKRALWRPRCAAP